MKEDIFYACFIFVRFFMRIYVRMCACIRTSARAKKSLSGWLPLINIPFRVLVSLLLRGNLFYNSRHKYLHMPVYLRAISARYFGHFFAVLCVIVCVCVCVHVHMYVGLFACLNIQLVHQYACLHNISLCAWALAYSCMCVCVCVCSVPVCAL